MKQRTGGAPVPQPLSAAAIGVGPLGIAVALRLQHAGFPVVGVDPSPDNAGHAERRGITMVDSLDEAANLASIAITELPSTAALEQLPTQLRRCPEQNIRYVIDISPLSACAKVRAADALKSDGITLLDCSIIGASAQIYDRDVLVCASGPEPAVEHVRPVLAALSRRVEYVGELGAGTKVKAVANHLDVLYNTATAEALTLAERIGLCPKTVWRIIAGDETICGQLELRGALMASGMYGPSSATVSSCVNELRRVTDLARSVQSPTPLLNTAAVLYGVAESMGYGDHDCSAVHASYVQLPHP